ncbi:MAG TPA: hypothetical protein PKC69_04655 [Chitinophagaceae bacterium]|nr:hypothetical protein [Chitinophagaceae bacterium]
MSRILLFLSSLFFYQTLYAQAGDSLFNKMVKDPLQQVYYQGWAQQSPIYNGRQFLGYSPAIIGNAYYKIDKWQNGAVRYEGTWYYDLPLLYDSYEGTVVTRAGAGLSYVIVKEKTSAFLIGTDEFVLMGTNKEEKIPAGFYQKIHDNGKLRLYIRRVKLLQEKIEGTLYERHFISADEFYVLVNGKYHLVKKQRHLLNLMKDRQRQVIQFKKQKGIRYKENRELFITSLIDYYNKL